MDLDHTFTVPVPVQDAWPILIDVERIVHCMPGAKLISAQGDAFTGEVRVKLGPITMTYTGDAHFAVLDETARRMVVDARGREVKGAGTASATVTATLTAQGRDTQVSLHTDLEVTGRAAQFGRGMVASVSDNLIRQFSTCLAAELEAGALQTAPSAAGEGGADAEIRGVPRPDVPAASAESAGTQQPAATSGTTPDRSRPESINGLRLIGGAMMRSVMTIARRIVGRLMRLVTRSPRDGR